MLGIDYQLHQKIDNLTGQIIASEFVLITANNNCYYINMHARTLASGLSKAQIYVLRGYVGVAGLPSVLLHPTPAGNDNILARIDNTLAEINGYRSHLSPAKISWLPPSII